VAANREHGGMDYADRRPFLAIPPPRALPRLVGWIALCLGGGFVIGMLFPPGAWFESLNQPAYAPPDWLFAPVWSSLYLLMAIAIWRVESLPVRAAPQARKLFLFQLALNFAWTPLFFGLHAITLALIVIGVLAFAILATIVVFMRLDRIGALMLLPYLAWVTFATLLNAGYALLN